MKIMLDTNVLISAFVFGGTTGDIMEVLMESDCELYVSEYVDSEFFDKLKQKWPNQAEKVYKLYRTLDINFCESTDRVLGSLRDQKDIPILSDAIYHEIDILLTGDKDFLEETIEKPLILSPAMVMEYLEQ